MATFFPSSEPHPEIVIEIARITVLSGVRTFIALAGRTNRVLSLVAESSERWGIDAAVLAILIRPRMRLRSVTLIIGSALRGGKQDWLQDFDAKRLIPTLQHSIRSLWLGATPTGFPPARHQTVSSSHVHPLVRRVCFSLSRAKRMTQANSCHRVCMRDHERQRFSESRKNLAR